MNTFPTRNPGKICTYCKGDAKLGRTIFTGHETTDEECYRVYRRVCFYCHIPIIRPMRMARRRKINELS